MQSTYLTAHETAERLGIKRDTLYAYVSRGLLRSVAVPGGRERGYRADEVERLPPDWRAVYLRCRAGLVTEPSQRFGTDSAVEERYVAEAWYATQRTWRSDLLVLCRYVAGSLLRCTVPGRS